MKRASQRASQRASAEVRRGADSVGLRSGAFCGLFGEDGGGLLAEALVGLRAEDFVGLCDFDRGGWPIFGGSSRGVFSLPSEVASAYGLPPPGVRTGAFCLRRVVVTSHFWPVRGLTSTLCPMWTSSGGTSCTMSAACCWRCAAACWICTIFSAMSAGIS